MMGKYLAVILQAILLVPGIHLAGYPRTDDRKTLNREKRQTFAQTSYSFTPTVACNPGVIVGTVNAPGTTYYTIDSTTPNVNLAVNSNTGQVLLINYLQTGVPYTATVRAFVGPLSTGASTATQVTVTCSISGTSGGSTGGSTGGTTGQVPVAAQSSYTFLAGTCTTGAFIGQVAVTNALNVVFGAAQSGTPFLVSNTGQITLSGSTSLVAGQTYVIQVTATNPYGTTTIPVTIIAGCSGTGTGTGTGSVSFPTFQQSSYSYTATACGTGSTVGTVAVSNPTSTTYTISPAATGYQVNPTTGVITLSGNPVISAGTVRSFTVSATNSAGTSSTQVTITATCGGTGTGGTATTRPTFISTSYSYSVSGSCAVGTIVGAVSVTSTSGTVTYSSSNSAFAVSSTGIITLTGNPVVTSGALTSFTITAFNSLGSTTVPVSVYPTCTSGTTTTGFRFQQSTYFFAPILCGASATIGTVNTLGATSTVTYSIDSPNLGYTISSTGVVTAPATGVVAGTITIRATSNGVATTAPLTISRQSCSTTTTGGTAPTFSQTCYTFQSLSGCSLFVNIGAVLASTTSGTITYSLPTLTVNNFGIDPNTGVIYPTVPNTQCNTLNVVARTTSGLQTTVPVNVDCTIGGSATCTCSGSGTQATTPCVVGTFGCADIG